MGRSNTGLTRVLSNEFLLVLLIVGFDWLRSSYGKLTGGEFVNGLRPTLEKFAEKNPNQIAKNFLESVAIPNATSFGYLVMWGEAIVAVTITVGTLILLVRQGHDNKGAALLAVGLLGGAFLNFIFWISAGWTSPSTDGLNLVMMVIELIGLVQLVRYVTNR
jgi:thiosulfate dehydrogenase (quinone) large subunit